MDNSTPAEELRPADEVLGEIIFPFLKQLYDEVEYEIAGEIISQLKDKGFLVVPVEPTTKMQYAVEDTDLSRFCTSSRQSRQHDIGVQIYRAMTDTSQENLA